MAFDTIAAACIAKELNEKLTGAKVEKIYQPEKVEPEFSGKPDLVLQCSAIIFCSIPKILYLL